MSSVLDSLPGPEWLALFALYTEEKEILETPNSLPLLLLLLFSLIIKKRITLLQSKLLISENLENMKLKMFFLEKLNVREDMVKMMIFCKCKSNNMSAMVESQERNKPENKP